MLLPILCLFATVFGKSKPLRQFKHKCRTSEGVNIETTLDANEPTLCDPNVQQYSGYLRSGATSNEYFYWFFESRTAPKNSPLIMWLTGGPGCSSQLALLTENGPCKVNKYATDTYLNPWSWNNNSNIMWVDQPPGTGFSKGKEVTTETEIAMDMWAFLQNFVSQFPEYFVNGFYVMGESYAGHYVPNIMNYIWKQNNAHSGKYINLKGFAIGNGLTDPFVQFQFYADMAYNSPQAKNSPYSKIPISERLYNEMTNAISKCDELITKCNSASGTANDCDNAYNYCMTNEVEPVTATGVNPYNINIPCENGNLCYNFTAEGDWLNNKTVQQQIGVDMKWNSCNTLVNIRLESDWMKDYQELVTGPINTNVRGLIYAGDLDFICNYLGNQQWSLLLPWNGQQSFNKATPTPWGNVNGKHAGLIRQGATTNFTFLQVYNAGHLCPMDQPQSAFEMVNAFITDTLKP